MKYIKIRFVTARRSHWAEHQAATAGIVVPEDRLQDGIAKLSRLFGMDAVGRDTFQRSPTYDTWEEAFGHDFDAA